MVQTQRSDCMETGQRLVNNTGQYCVQQEVHSPSMSPRVNSSPNSARVVSMFSMGETNSPWSILSVSGSPLRLSPKGRRREQTDGWTSPGRPATPSRVLSYLKMRPLSLTAPYSSESPRQADLTSDKLTHQKLFPRRRHLVLR